MTKEKQDSENISFEEMVRRGNLTPPTGHLDGEAENPLKDLLCAEVSALMEDFCDGEIGDTVVLIGMEKHLFNSVSGAGKCDCWENFLAIKKRKEGKQ